jgi:hypothetical protein
MSRLDATIAVVDVLVVVPLRTTGQTYHLYVPGVSVMLRPACRQWVGTEMCGALVVTEKTDWPLCVISNVYPSAFATGAHANTRLEAEA